MTCLWRQLPVLAFSFCQTTMHLSSWDLLPTLGVSRNMRFLGSVSRKKVGNSNSGFHGRIVASCLWLFETQFERIGEPFKSEVEI